MIFQILQYPHCLALKNEIERFILDSMNSIAAVAAHAQQNAIKCVFKCCQMSV